MNHCANCNGSPRVEPNRNEIRAAADERVRAMDEIAVHLLEQCADENGFDLAKTPFKPTAYALERAGYVTIGMGYYRVEGQRFGEYREVAIITKSGKLALEMARKRQ